MKDYTFRDNSGRTWGVSSHTVTRHTGDDMTMVRLTVRSASGELLKTVGGQFSAAKAIELGLELIKQGARATERVSSDEADQ